MYQYLFINYDQPYWCKVLIIEGTKCGVWELSLLCLHLFSKAKFILKLKVYLKLLVVTLKLIFYWAFYLLFAESGSPILGCLNQICILELSVYLWTKPPACMRSPRKWVWLKNIMSASGDMARMGVSCLSIWEHSLLCEFLQVCFLICKMETRIMPGHWFFETGNKVILITMKVKFCPSSSIQPSLCICLCNMNI